jgi:peptide deformylase
VTTASATFSLNVHAARAHKKHNTMRASHAPPPALAPRRRRHGCGCARRAAAPARAAAASPYRGTSSRDGGWTPAGDSALGGFGGFLRAAQAREPVQAGTPVLRDRARELSLEELAAPETQALIEEMVLVSRARGVGLAAPQLGVGVAIIVLEDTAEDVLPADVEAQERRPFSLKVLVNPRVSAKQGAARVAFFEGCLSVQGYRGLVERALEVDVTALGGDGQPVAFTARGWQVKKHARMT